MHVRRIVPVVLMLTFGAFGGCLGSEEGGVGTESGEGAGDGPANAPEDRNRDGRIQKGERPHVHDYWFGADTLVLLDENVEVMLVHNHMFDEPPREQHTHGCDETAASTSQGGSRKFSLPPGQTVLPGTERLEFTFSWTDPSITGLRFLYRAAGTGHVGHDDHVRATRGSGGTQAPEFQDAGTVESDAPIIVRLMPEMADDGHALRSQWAFFLCADTAPVVGVAQGKVRTTIVAHRAAEIPVAPAHPDHWAGQDALPLGGIGFSGVGAGALNKGEGVWHRIAIDDGAIVPPGAARVVVEVTLDSSIPWAAVDPGTVLLYWQDSAVPGWSYAKARPEAGEGDAARFVIRVEPDGVDSHYATVSNWDLWLRVLSRQHTETPAGDLAAPHLFEGDLEAAAWVERDPAE